MLALTRRDDESIHIGSDIRVVVIRSRNGRVTLGVEAPHDVRILRGEFLTPESLADTVPAIPVVHDEAAATIENSGSR